MTDRVRQDLVDVENMDGMVRFSWLFEALTVNMEKIWSFYETVDTNLQVRTRASGGTGSTKIHRMVSFESVLTLSCCSKMPLGS